MLSADKEIKYNFDYKTIDIYVYVLCPENCQLILR